jgi:chloramphenicol O-acetyltransferase type B
VEDGKNVMIFTKDVLKGSYDHIGEYTYGSPSVVRAYPECSLTIGKFCSIGNGVTFAFWGRHATEDITTYPFEHLPGWPSVKSSLIEGENIYVGNDVWIANNVLVLQGAYIRDGAVLGANCVVGGEVKPYTIVVGNPAKSIRQRFSDEEIKKLLKMRWWNWNIIDIKRNLPVICSSKVDVLYEIWRRGECQG